MYKLVKISEKDNLLKNTFLGKFWIRKKDKSQGFNKVFYIFDSDLVWRMQFMIIKG